MLGHPCCERERVGEAQRNKGTPPRPSPPLPEASMRLSSACASTLAGIS